MHVQEFCGVSGHHKGKVAQCAWKQMNKSLSQEVLVNSRCLKDQVR